MAKTPPTLRDRVERLIGEYIRLDQRADDAIDSWVEAQKLKCPGVPAGVIRQCELEARALGHVRSIMLERLREKLS